MTLKNHNLFLIRLKGINLHLGILKVILIFKHQLTL